MWLDGSNGVLRLDGDGRLWWKSYLADEREHVYDRGLDTTFGGGACGALRKHVLDALDQKSPFENSAPDYLRNLLVQEAVYASHTSGRRVELSGFVPSATSPNLSLPSSAGSRSSLAPSTFVS